MKPISAFDKLLYLFIAFIAVLIVFRVQYFGNNHFVFLLWNLFLAWMPYAFSKYFDRIKIFWKQWLLAVLWLLFLPNAFYIVTDLIHLQHVAAAHVWFDTAVIFSAATAGLIMALVSLYRMEQFLAGKFNRHVVTVIISFVLLLASFGVYLGRYLRWNSWDIVANPVELLISVAGRVVYPLEHMRTWGMTFVFTAIFSLLYYTFKKLPALVIEIKKDGF